MSVGYHIDSDVENLQRTAELQPWGVLLQNSAISAEHNGSSKDYTFHLAFILLIQCVCIGKGECLQFCLQQVKCMLNRIQVKLA